MARSVKLDWQGVTLVDIDLCPSSFSWSQVSRPGCDRCLPVMALQRWRRSGWAVHGGRDRPAVGRGWRSCRLSSLASLSGTQQPGGLYSLWLTAWHSLPPSCFLSGQLPMEKVRLKGSYATVPVHIQCLHLVCVYFHSWPAGWLCVLLSFCARACDKTFLLTHVDGCV